MIKTNIELELASNSNRHITKPITRGKIQYPKTHTVCRNDLLKENNRIILMNIFVFKYEVHVLVRKWITSDFEYIFYSSYIGSSKVEATFLIQKFRLSRIRIIPRKYPLTRFLHLLGKNDIFDKLQPSKGGTVMKHLKNVLIIGNQHRDNYWWFN